MECMRASSRAAHSLVREVLGEGARVRGEERARDVPLLRGGGRHARVGVHVDVARRDECRYYSSQ